MTSSRFQVQRSRSGRREPGSPTLAEGRVSGELEGTWRWSLRAEDGGTRVVFEEEVGTNKRILDLLAPVANRLFALNHRVAARRGAEGMRKWFRRG